MTLDNSRYVLLLQKFTIVKYIYKKIIYRHLCKFRIGTTIIEITMLNQIPILNRLLKIKLSCFFKDLRNNSFLEIFRGIFVFVE